MKKTVKELKYNALDLLEGGGVSNADKFVAGVPLMIELQDRLEKMKQGIKELTMIANTLGESLSDYADTHKKALTTPLVVVKDELEVGSVVIDGTEYTYTRGWSGLKRTGGDNLNAMFLKGLPKSWVKERLELDVSNIGDLGISDDELLEKGLMWKRKRTWAQKEN